MTPAYRPAQIRAMDARAAARGVDRRVLVERSGGHLARCATQVAGFTYGLRVAVLCGRGDNGADGIAAARRLLDAGARPLVHVVEHPQAGSQAAMQLAAFTGAGGRMSASAEAAVKDAHLVLDCLLGTGASGAPRPAVAAAVAAIDRQRARGTAVVACDVPTGIDADRGAVFEDAVTADVTLTLGAMKRGLLLSPAREHAGRVVVADIGVDDGADPAAALVLEAADVAALVPPLAGAAYKRSRGVVLAVAGSPGMSGAATMVVWGAMAAGAGLVQMAADPAVRDLIAPTVPQSLTLALPEDPQEAFALIEAQLSASTALVVGPGLGRAPQTQALVRRLVHSVAVPLVLDADGLNAFAEEPDALADHASSLLVLTPHQGEWRRLSDTSWEDRVDAVPDAAKRWDATIVAKGPGTLIAAPDGRVWINRTGGPSLGTGGSGDVLAGMTAALVAARPEPAGVAAAVWLHGAAGEAAARRSHPRSVHALGIADAVADVLRDLEGAR